MQQRTSSTTNFVYLRVTPQTSKLLYLTLGVIKLFCNTFRIVRKLVFLPFHCHFQRVV